MVASAIFGGIIGVIAPLFDLAGIPVIADIAISVLTTVFFLPYYAIIAAAYRQLRDDQISHQSPSGPVNTSQVP